MNTAAMAPVARKASTPALSPTSRKWTPGMRGRKGAWYASRSVTASDPMRRPWKEPRNAMNPVFSSAPAARAQRRENFIAASLASAPELQKKTLDGKAPATSARASSCAGRVAKRLDVWMRPHSRASLSAWATTGEPWPSADTAIPEVKSR